MFNTSLEITIEAFSQESWITIRINHLVLPWLLKFNIECIPKYEKFQAL